MSLLYTQAHSAKPVKIRSNSDAMKYFFSRRVTDRWNKLDQQVVSVSDASSISGFKSHLNKIRDTQVGFLWITAEPYEPHLWTNCS